MIVRVAVEDVLVVVGTLCHKFDKDTVLLEEISCFEAACLSELAVIRARGVQIGVLLGSLLKAAKYYDLIARDLEGSHVKHGLGHAKIE